MFVTEVAGRKLDHVREGVEVQIPGGREQYAVRKVLECFRAETIRRLMR